LNISALSYRRFLLVINIWWAVWLFFFTIALHQMGWSWSVSLIDSLVSNVTLALFSAAVGNVLRFYRPSKKLYNLLFWGISIALVWCGVVFFALSSIYGDEKNYIDFLNLSLYIRFCYGFLLIGCTMLISWVWYYTTSQKQQADRSTDVERLAKEAELNSLRQQLQPHFLFNSLNSINALIGSRPEEARKMIQQLSDFLRGTLRKDDSQLVPLSDEVQQVRLYLEIEQVRFGHRLKTEMIIDEATQIYHLPPLILQPVVENAIKFGLYDTIGETCITIKTTLLNGELYITVENPFDVETTTPPKGTGFGLSSIQRRLYLVYGRNDLLTTETEKSIYKTTIKIPRIND
jgi:hypothetical protein